MKSNFLNVDLELLSRKNLRSLVEQLGDSVLILYQGRPPAGCAGNSRKRFFLSMEYSDPTFRSPDRTIYALCALIEELPAGPRRLWDEAEKVFDVGYQLHSKGRLLTGMLKARTIQRIAQLGATVAMTCYREDS